MSTAIALLLCASCVPEEGPLMAPGRDCIECHGGGDARSWTAAGTWSRGATITVTDANGKTVTMRGNKVGNFYTAEPLAHPLRVDVDGVPMAADALQSALWTSATMNYGGCNLCHTPGGGTIDLELMAAGRDCLRCHDGSTATRYTVAGTWRGATAIIVRDQGGNGAAFEIPVTGGAVGNFHTDRTFTGQLQFTVQLAGGGTETMEPLVDYGGCNACHGNGEDDD